MINKLVHEIQLFSSGNKESFGAALLILASTSEVISWGERWDGGCEDKRC